MRRAQFIKGSAIVGAASIIPQFLKARSGMFEISGERRVAQILDAKRSMVQNVPVLRAFAGGKNDLVSPFVMLDEFGPLDVGPGTIGMDIQAHPHAGVVPTTYLVKGSGRHTDSMANDIVYHEGQYMLFNSGSGAIHEEVSDEQLRANGGIVHGFQIWLNLPAKEKFCTPSTAIHNPEKLPVIETAEYRVKVLIGSLFGQSSPTETYTPTFYYHVKIQPNGRLDIPVTSGHNAFVYVVNGELELEGRHALQDAQMALYEREGDRLRYHSVEGCEFLLLGGQPLNEPVVSYGPFVMNTQEQINLCFQNYRAGRMGEL